MLLETRGDYEFADLLRHSLGEIAKELKRSNDIREKEVEKAGKFEELKKAITPYAEADIPENISDEMNAVYADCNSLYKDLERLEQSRLDTWDITWTNIIDSMVNTHSDKAYPIIPRFGVGQKDEILCGSITDAECVTAFLKAIGFDGACAIKSEFEGIEYCWEIHPNGA